jgi:hypothetical protein
MVNQYGQGVRLGGGWGVPSAVRQPRPGNGPGQGGGNQPTGRRFDRAVHHRADRAAHRFLFFGRGNLTALGLPTGSDSTRTNGPDLSGHWSWVTIGWRTGLPSLVPHRGRKAIQAWRRGGDTVRLTARRHRRGGWSRVLCVTGRWTLPYPIRSDLWWQGGGNGPSYWRAMQTSPVHTGTPPPGAARHVRQRRGAGRQGLPPGRPPVLRLKAQR